MRAGEVTCSFRRKESEVQYGEVPYTVSRPSGSASSSRGTFSCRRWRQLSGKPSTDDDAFVSTHKPSLVTTTPGMVQRPTMTEVDSNNWATAATPFAAFLPRDTITPITSRKSVATAVLTAPFPPENVKKFDREMIICERKHVKAMGRMTTRIYRSKSAKADRSEQSRKHKSREKQALKDQIYLPVLCQEQTGGNHDVLPPRISKLIVHTSPRQDTITTEIPESLAGMKLLSSQLDELRVGLELSSRDRETYGRSAGSWCQQLQHSTMKTLSCTTQRPNTIKQPEDTDSSSSSIETLLLRVLERPQACMDGYQADQEENATDSRGDINTKSLESRSANNSEYDLLHLLSTLDSPFQDEF